jgi:type IV secretory pathway VirB2 component (pilin)
MKPPKTKGMAILAILAGLLNALYMLLGGEMPNWQDVMLLVVGVGSLFGIKAAGKTAASAESEPEPPAAEAPAPPDKPNTDAPHGPRR